MKKYSQRPKLPNKSYILQKLLAIVYCHKPRPSQCQLKNLADKNLEARGHFLKNKIDWLFSYYFFCNTNSTACEVHLSTNLEIKNLTPAAIIFFSDDLPRVFNINLKNEI